MQMAMGRRTAARPDYAALAKGEALSEPDEVVEPAGPGPSSNNSAGQGQQEGDEDGSAPSPVEDTGLFAGKSVAKSPKRFGKRKDTDRREKRLLANRKSAQKNRSKRTQEAQCLDLHVARAAEEVEDIKAEVERYRQRHEALLAEHDRLVRRLQDLQEGPGQNHPLQHGAQGGASDGFGVASQAMGHLNRDSFGSNLNLLPASRSAPLLPQHPHGRHALQHQHLRPSGALPSFEDLMHPQPLYEEAPGLPKLTGSHTMWQPLPQGSSAQVQSNVSRPSAPLTGACHSSPSSAPTTVTSTAMLRQSFPGVFQVHASQSLFRDARESALDDERNGTTLSTDSARSLSTYCGAGSPDQGLQDVMNHGSSMPPLIGDQDLTGLSLVAPSGLEDYLKPEPFDADHPGWGL